jgi:hypothetical protein
MHMHLVTSVIPIILNKRQQFLEEDQMKAFEGEEVMLDNQLTR